MTEEYVWERERDLLDYFRNNFTDPSSRGTDIVNESFTATASQTVFTLANTLVKNVADSISVEGVTKRKGFDYSVQYGEGTNTTTVTLLVGANLNDTVLISYHYGESIAEREFSRTDVTLPRMVISFLTGSEEYAGLGDLLEDGRGSYFNASFQVEIRDKYASRARVKASQAFNWAKKMRHANLFRLVIATPTDLRNFDYDPDKNAYVWFFTITLQWDMIFNTV